VLYSIHVCKKEEEELIEILLFFIFILIAVIATSEVPSFLKQISTLSDTILLFKEDKNPVFVIRDVSTIKSPLLTIWFCFFGDSLE